MGLDVGGLGTRGRLHPPVSPCCFPLVRQTRLYPVVPGNSRVPDKDIRVGDYIIPKNVSRAYGPLLLSHPSQYWAPLSSQTLHISPSPSLWHECLSLGCYGAVE